VSWFEAFEHVEFSAETITAVTTRARAAQIFAEGFRDSRGDSLFPAGVWLSDSSDKRHRAMRVAVAVWRLRKPHSQAV
jgi:hypothetical protein